MSDQTSVKTYHLTLTVKPLVINAGEVTVILMYVLIQMKALELHCRFKLDFSALITIIFVARVLN